MRNRLAMAFLGVICLTLGLVYLFIQNSVTVVLQNSFSTSFQRQIQPLIPKLTNYYESNGQSWEGVGSVLFPLVDSNDRILPGDLVLIDVNGIVISPVDIPLFGQELDYLSLKSALPISSNESTIGYLGSTIMLENLPRIVSEDFNRLFSRSIMISLLASGIIAMFYAMLANNTIVQPITDMTKTVEKMAQGELHLRVNPEKYGYQNLVTLAESINLLTHTIEESGKQRHDMITDIAHELRTPLAVQKSYLEAMEDDVIPFSLDSLKIIQAQNFLLTRLVNDLRLLANAESGELRLVLRQVDLTLVLMRVVQEFSAKFEEAKLTVNLLTPDSHPIILGDPNRLEQIINNLFQNERRYAPPGTDLEIACYIRDHKAVLTVRDYGIGVREEELETIFQRLYRTDRGIKSETSGSGLGLPIARKLAELHSGTLTASLPKGKGVIFTLSLPLAYEPIKLSKRRGGSTKISLF